jgi:transposase InsO family protein
LCYFCGAPGHLEKDCHKKKKASEDAKKNTSYWKEKGRFGRGKGGKQAAKEATQEDGKTESAGQASALSSSDRTTWLQSRAATDWNPDTGASSHMTPHRHWFLSYSPHVVPVRLADNSIIYSAGKGSVEFQPTKNGVHMRPVVFHDALHVPKLSSNLLSLLHLTREKEYKIIIEEDTLEFIREGAVLFTATVNEHNVGYLNGHTIVPHFANLSSTLPLNLTLWHNRCSHVNFDALKRMHSQHLVTGMEIRSKASPDPVCEPCILGKQHRHNIPKTATRRTLLLELVHTDLKGPLPVQTPEGYRYWQPFIDDKSRFMAIAFLKQKSEALQSFKQFKAYAENKLGRKIKATRDDKGGEFIGKEFQEFCAKEGIMQQHTETNEPHQNGVAERANESIAAGATALLVQAKLPPSFWAHAVATYVHTRNRTPTSALKGETPYFYWKGKRPDISYFRVFGCLAYVLVHRNKRKALQPHSRKCIFVGYPEGVKAWRFWDPVERKFIISSHAVFDERCFPGNSAAGINLMGELSLPRPLPAPSQVVLHQGGDESDSEEEPLVPPVVPAPPPPFVLAPPVPPLPPAPPQRINPPRASRYKGSLNEDLLSRQSSIPPSLPAHSLSPSPDPLLLAPTVTLEPPTAPEPDSASEDELLLNDHADLEHADAIHEGLEYVCSATHYDYLTFDEAAAYALKSSQSHEHEPKTLKEAMQRPDEAEKWYKAAMEEIQSLIENGTFELVQLPPGRKAIGSRWVFKVKRNADGSIERYKARFVAQGFAQRPGFDFTETFAPTPKWAALRAILALAAIEDLELESVDISSAYLNGELTEEVYVRQPEGFVEKGKDWYWKLLKSLYGLKQAGRCWHKKLNEVLVQLGFKRTVCEHSIWVFQRGEDRIIIPVFIDDMTIAARSKEAIQKVKDDLRKHFKLRDLGPTSFLLGVEVKRNRSTRTLTLSQKQYVLDLLERFSLSDCNTVTTPLDPSVRLSSAQSPQTQEDIEAMRSVPYLQAVGALMYLAVATRPDIAYAVGVLARFNKNPGPLHWKAVKHLFRYLKGTLDYTLTYSGSTPSSELFSTYTDADHAGNPDNGRSTSGYVVKMGNGAISWSSRLQGIVALSTTEAEYVAATSAGQEIIWLRNLFTELGYTFDSPSTLHIDNRSAISVAKNPEHHGRMKHLDLRFYWLRDEVDKGRISISHLRTDAMPADILTKALGRVKVGEMVEMLGLRL